MKKSKCVAVLLAILGAYTFYSCETQDFESGELVLDLPNTPYSYNVSSNNHLPTLGRVLFYDTRLSTNNSVSCGSCHKQQLAFADRADLSFGFENKLTSRNSMPIQNIVSNTFFFDLGSTDSLFFRLVTEGKVTNGSSTTNFVFDPGFGFFQPTALFWDGRQHSLEKMVMEPIQNHIEMGTTNFEGLSQKLSQYPEYSELFSNAFDDGAINADHIAKALSAFLVSIRSNQSKFDKTLVGMAHLNGLEQLGKDLFFDKYDCNSCHQLQAPFNGYQLAGDGQFGGFANIGLEDKPSDPGLRKVTNNPEDDGKFKIPSLRNIALTAPYMHDGRLETLDDVLDHYSENIEETDNLDQRLRNMDGSAKQFKIPASDKKAIIAFLNSLTDYEMISDPKFANPFRLK